MGIQTTKMTNFLSIVLLAICLATPSLAQAGRGHRGHGHDRHHGHHHLKHHNHFNGYGYSQPRGYYRPYYPQPQYNHYPAPVYVPPPQMMMGIGGGHMDFMLRF